MKQSFRKLLWHFSHGKAAAVGRGCSKASPGFQRCRTHRQFHPEMPGSRMQPSGVEHKVVSPHAGDRHSIPEGPAGQCRPHVRPHVQGHVAGTCGDRDVCPRVSHVTTCFPTEHHGILELLLMSSKAWQKCLPYGRCFNFFLSIGISEMII